jgi:hypothetical protein
MNTNQCSYRSKLELLKLILEMILYAIQILVFFERTFHEVT